MGRGRKRSLPADTTQEEAPPPPGLVALHRARCIEWQPTGLVTLAASGDGSIVAALRDSGDVELYETSTSYLFQRLPGIAGPEATCLTLVYEEEGGAGGGPTARLFLAGLDGGVVEYDVEKRRVAAVTDSMGGAVWQLAPEPGACVRPGSPARVAVACDDGCVRIFAAESGAPGLVYVRSLPRVEGRTVAVAWHPSGEAIVTAGTDGCIHVWSVTTGRELLRITAGDGRSSKRRKRRGKRRGGGGAGAAPQQAAAAEEQQQENGVQEDGQELGDMEGGDGSNEGIVIWALLVLPDGTLVSGDSRGHVSFWDARTGTLLQRFSHHNAAVLRLVAALDGSTVFATGVDPQMTVLQKLEGGTAGASGRPTWVYLSTKRPHTHDVRAMCMVAGKHAPDPRIWTGSNDTTLLNHSLLRFLKEHPRKVNTAAQMPLMQTARTLGSGAAGSSSSSGGGDTSGQLDGPLLLSVQRDELDLWQLGCAPMHPSQRQHAHEGGRLGLARPPTHLLRLLGDAGSFVVAAALSPDGRLLAFSDAKQLCVFRLAEQGPSEEVPLPHLAPTRVQLPPGLPPATHLAWRPGTQCLVASAADGTLHVVDLVGGGGQNGSAAPSATAVRAVHDLQYRASYRRDRGRSAARRLMPAVEQLAVSPDGSWLAVVSRQRVHLVSLEGGAKLVHSLPQLAEPQPPLTALGFTADSASLVVAASTHQVAAYEVGNGQLTPWAAAAAEDGLPPRLLQMPGRVDHVACSPGRPGSVVLQSLEAVCHLDITRPLQRSAAGSKRRRRRPLLKPTNTTSPAGENCRVIYCEDYPCVFAAYIGPHALLVVERQWEEVYKGIVAPMWRRRFGG